MGASPRALRALVYPTFAGPDGSRRSANMRGSRLRFNSIGREPSGLSRTGQSNVLRGRTARAVPLTKGKARFRMSGITPASLRENSQTRAVARGKKRRGESLGRLSGSLAVLFRDLQHGIVQFGVAGDQAGHFQGQRIAVGVGHFSAGFFDEQSSGGEVPGR